jgi:hypothetical protein
MYNEKIVDVLTGEEIIRPYTEEEIAAVIASQKQLAEEDKIETAKKTAKESARNKLIDLGLTEDEIAAL